ncbi:clathrin, heavy polypeptide [Babesia microti strain RI]|uniref:Clathrin heavy chain n=1 Tax=Babesia microti (strain RI) TaxID=1133968 RepID=A0A1N6LWT6_BABMR|nr:clathrin, heavy polypeptide [Babesia microti strain RI]SIO73338.1 clathrin, heavy polypeptide [Babesia microti strain RI]|eukprot:XP_021337440.1 clathrin, heavy polypeptide [Babesia microti strain RI]
MAVISYKTIVNLKELGLNPSFFRFNVLTMESCRHVCLKDISPDGTQLLAIVDLKECNVTRKHMKGESAILNPTHFTICIKGHAEGVTGHYVQVFNLEFKIMLADHKFDEFVVFWKWLSEDEIAIVTEYSVYHWRVNPQRASQVPPEKIFERLGKLKDDNVQIINYQSDPTRQWCLLSSISTEDQGKTMDGHMMLYSTVRKQHQILQGHAGVFGNIKSKTGEIIPVLSFVEKKSGSTPKLHVMDIFSQSLKLTSEFEQISDPSDFPVSIVILEKIGMLAIVTRSGYFFLHDTMYLDRIMSVRVSMDTIFAIVKNDGSTDANGKVDGHSSGCTMVNKSGHIIEVKVDGRELVQYLRKPSTASASGRLSNDHFFEISTALMRIYGLPGDESDMKNIFFELFQRGEFKRAAIVAASTPSLRSRDTIQMFKQAKSAPGETQPILQYFTVLLEHGRLDEFESLELIKPIVSQKKIDVIERLFNANNLTPSKSLGDMIKGIDPKLAMTVYVSSKSYESAINTLIEIGDLRTLISMVQYEECGFHNGELTFKGGMPLSDILSAISASCPDKLVEFLQMLHSKGCFNGKNITEAPFTLLVNCGRLQEVTTFLLDLLKDNDPIHGHLQTFLLVENLKRAPKIAEHIFNLSIFTHFDKSVIGPLAESVGMPSIALQCYNSIEKVESLLLNNPGLLKPQVLREMISSMSIDDSILLVEFVLKNKILPSSDVINSIERPTIGISELYRLCMSIEDYGSQENLYVLLKKYIQLPGSKFTQNPPIEVLRESELHFKLIASATSVGDLTQVELVCKTSNSINPDKVKTFFKGKEEFKRDPRAFIYMADRFSYYGELASLLVDCDPRFMQVYLSRMNRDAAPKIVKSLLTDSTITLDEDRLLELLKTLNDDQIEAVCTELSQSELVPEVMYKILTSKLEGLKATSPRYINTFTLLAKISIKKGTAEHYLSTYTNYDREEVACYCRHSHPELAFIAYKGDASKQSHLVELAYEKELYETLSKHVLEAQDLQLWSLVLSHEDSDSFISELTSNVLPECKNSQQVSIAIKALMDAKMNYHLITLLDRLILSKSNFSDNRNLQNLLLVTALREKSDKLETYIDVCTNCDVNQVAKLALELDEVDHALNLYIRSGNMAEAVRVLLDKGDLDGAAKLADQVDDRLIYGCVAQSFLPIDLTLAVDYFSKSGDPSYYSAIVDACKEKNDYVNLIRYLTQGENDGGKLRSYLSLSRDTDLAYAYAFSGDIDSLKSFIQGKNNANLNSVGDAIFPHNPSTAKILYTAAMNHHNLALCHVKLGEYKEAVDACILSTLPHIKLEVAVACLENNCIDDASRLIKELVEHPDLLGKLADKYEELGFYKQLMHKLAEYVGYTEEEATDINANLPATATPEKDNIATLLSIYLVKYTPEIVFDFIEKYKNKLYGDKLVAICEKYHMYKEAAYIYIHILYNYDKSARIMIDHFGLAWDHKLILACAPELSPVMLQDVVTFYLENFPNLVMDLLQLVEDKLDQTRLVIQAKKHNLIWLIKDHLEKIQRLNISSVNNALNDLYIDNCDYQSLERSISLFDSFDQNSVLVRIKTHQMVEMKRVAATIYYINKSYKQCLQVSLETGNYKQALFAAAQTDSAIVHHLLGYFVTKSLHAEFIACYCICYNLIDPTLVLELIFNKQTSDSFDLYSFVMPFFIQTMATFNERLLKLERKL